MYRYGEGSEINYKKAYEWFKKAVDNNDAYSNYMLGDIYENGMGDIKQDNKKAQSYYKKAAELGYEDAKNKIIQ